MNTRMEVPEPKGDLARVLLMLEERESLTPEDVPGGLRALSAAVQGLQALGWKFLQFPRGNSSEPGKYGDVRFGIPTDSHRREHRDAILTRFRTAGYREWKKEALAALSGEEAPMKPESDEIAGQPLTAQSFTGLPTSRLKLPLQSDLAFRVMFAAMHLGTVTPEIVGLTPLRFVGIVHGLRSMGWPLVMSAIPLAASWTGVADDVLAAWRETFGARGMRECIAGELG